MLSWMLFSQNEDSFVTHGGGNVDIDLREAEVC